MIHVAAFASDWGKYKYFYDVNVKGTKNVCELCLQNSVKHLIHFSSVSVYGFGNRVAAEENTQIIKNNFNYCITKLLAEETVKHFMDVFNLPATIIQPGQIYGPNDRTTFFPIISALLKGQFGFLNSGKYLLSPLYIDNLIQSILLIIKQRNKSLGQTYIVTDNIQISWHDYIQSFCKQLKVPMPKLNLPKTLVMIVAYSLEGIYKFFKIKKAPKLTVYLIALAGNNFNFSSNKLIRQLGYKPNKDINTHIAKTIESYYKYMNQSNNKWR